MFIATIDKEGKLNRSYSELLSLTLDPNFAELLKESGDFKIGYNTAGILIMQRGNASIALLVDREAYDTLTSNRKVEGKALLLPYTLELKAEEGQRNIIRVSRRGGKYSGFHVLIRDLTAVIDLCGVDIHHNVHHDRRRNDTYAREGMVTEVREECTPWADDAHQAVSGLTRREDVDEVNLPEATRRLRDSLIQHATLCREGCVSEVKPPRGENEVTFHMDFSGYHVPKVDEKVDQSPAPAQSAAWADLEGDVYIPPAEKGPQPSSEAQPTPRTQGGDAGYQLDVVGVAKVPVETTPAPEYPHRVERVTVRISVRGIKDPFALPTDLMISYKDEIVGRVVPLTDELATYGPDICVPVHLGGVILVSDEILDNVVKHAKIKFTEVVEDGKLVRLFLEDVAQA